ncbi:hypothetical protein QVD17_19351 [Tagetes erecta]|uniref:60S ribosomal protein L18a-like protein n=1 Tax=Tagetes erecta TaxID=13708 RepID=A0AAD8KJB3_TARER|nr:hypothetical protein QVD17_19351 [Tagetes erecta]
MNEQPPQPQAQAQAHEYGTFEGVGNYPPPAPVIGYPPGGTSVNTYVHGYHTVTGYAIAEGRPVRERRLSCCGIGIGWFLFIIGFFLAAIPWYVGAFILICARYNHREKPGYIACLIAAILGTIAVIFCVTSDEWDWEWD